MKNKHSRAKVIEMLKEEMDEDQAEWWAGRKEISKIKRSKQKKTQRWDDLVFEDRIAGDRIYAQDRAIELLEEKE